MLMLGGLSVALLVVAWIIGNPCRRDMPLVGVILLCFLTLISAVLNVFAVMSILEAITKSSLPNSSKKMGWSGGRRNYKTPVR
jgi:RsiW-degrading membrane proteinase PrsW (M82 family)